MSAKIKAASELDQYREKLKLGKKPDRKVLSICTGTGCCASGATKLAERFQEALADRKLSDKVELLRTGCHGFCERGPLVVLFPEGICYERVKEKDVEEIIDQTIGANKLIERLIYSEPMTGEKFDKEAEIPFYKHQKRLVLAHNGQIDPTSIDDYIAIGGYSALAKALDMGPRAVLEEVKKANLRGRGGAGFPAGRKWEICAGTKADKRYLVCNADEGDPGAFMDRSVIEGNPHSVIEGMLIGALAIGADEGYVYVRHEYPLAVERLGIAIRQAHEKGLLGKNILGSDLAFDLHINRGGGAFVCGEESALIASLEGRVGEPRRRPPYPAVAGLHGKPTNINNVETWANVRWIINQGADWYRSIGTEGSKGTKIFSLVGKVNNTGLVEVPMGVSLRHIIYDIGGGIPDGKKFKAVQTGGPSGGCLPESMLDMQVDFDRLTEAGSMMGSGGMIVMDESTCMVDVARYFIAFLADESCGKCTSCREGLRQASRIMERICGGEGKEEDIQRLEELVDTIKEASLCALGATAPNPVLSTLRYFREEYEEHVLQKKCRAAVCKALITYSIVGDKCTGCMICAKKCPEDAITGKKKEVHILDESKCIRCGVCYDVCKFDAVHVE